MKSAKIAEKYMIPRMTALILASVCRFSLRIDIANCEADFSSTSSISLAFVGLNNRVIASNFIFKFSSDGVDKNWFWRCGRSVAVFVVALVLVYLILGEFLPGFQLHLAGFGGDTSVLS